MIDSPLRALTPKGRILWCSNSGRSNKNLMSEIRKAESLEPAETGVEMGLVDACWHAGVDLKYTWFESELSDQANARPPYPGYNEGPW